MSNQTYDSKLTLDLAQHPRSPEDLQDPEVLYDELLDIHHAIEQLAQGVEDGGDNTCSCIKVCDTELICSNYEIDEVDHQSEMLHYYDTTNTTGSIDYGNNALRYEATFEVFEDQIWLLLPRTASVGSWSTNYIWYSDDFGANWEQCHLPFDWWQRVVDGDYDRTGSQWNDYKFLKLEYSLGKLYGLAIFNGSPWNFLLFRGDTGLPPFVGADQKNVQINYSENGWEVFYSSFVNSASNNWYTGAHTKVFDRCYTFSMGAGITISGGDRGVYQLWNNIPIGPYAERVDSSRHEVENIPLIQVPAGEYDDPDEEAKIKMEVIPQLMQELDVSGGNDDAHYAYGIGTVGPFVLVGSSSTTLWSFDTQSAGWASPPNDKVRQVNYTFFTDTLEFQAQYNDKGWIREEDEAGPNDPKTNRNATNVCPDEGIETWGWVDADAVYIPWDGVQGNGAARGKFWKIDFIESGSVPTSSGLYIPTYSRTRTELDFSSLLTSSDANDDVTDIDCCRLYHAGGRFILVWAWRDLNSSNNWPRHFYMRIADKAELSYFSPAIKVDNPTGLTGEKEIASRSYGGVAVKYSTSQRKFLIFSTYNISGAYRVGLSTLDDPFYCTLTEEDTSIPDDKDVLTWNEENQCYAPEPVTWGYIQGDISAQQDMVNRFVTAGYGGMKLDTADTAYPDLGATWQTVPFDADFFETPKGVVQDFTTNDSLTIEASGVWMLTVNIAFAHTADAANVRTTYLRLYDITDSDAPGGTFPIVIGRGATETSESICTPVVVLPPDAGHEFRLEIGGGDTVVIDDAADGLFIAQWSLIHVSEYTG